MGKSAEPQKPRDFVNLSSRIHPKLVTPYFSVKRIKTTPPSSDILTSQSKLKFCYILHTTRAIC